MIKLIPIEIHCDCEGGKQLVVYTIQDFYLENMKCPTCGQSVFVAWYDGIAC